MPNTLWQNRIKLANKNYRAWATKFKCDVLEEYYENKQWKFDSILQPEPYSVNLVYSTIKIKAANLLLSYPKYLITPRPGNSDWNQEQAILSSQTKEDTLNTVVSNDREAFAQMCHLAFLDSQFRFGVMEVGYAAEFIRNPLAQRPLRNNQVTEVNKDTKIIDQDKVKIEKQPEPLPEFEKIFFKHIPARRFRVGGKDSPVLDRADWVGYYEFFYRDDLLVIDGIKSDYLRDARPSSVDEAFDTGSKITGTDEKPSGDILKVWHCWDLRSRKRYLILDSPCEVVWEDSFKRLPIMDLRWDMRLLGWYPIPPVYYWLSPQNEYNESREMMRNYRKRFLRKYQCVGDLPEEEEMDKFTSNEDGAVIKVGQVDQIRPIMNPPLDSVVKESLLISKDDFNEVSGTSSADRGRADRTTATESQRLGMKADVRDSADDAVMLGFMKRIGREALLLMRERLVQGVWSELSADPGEGFLGEISDQTSYQYVTSEQLNDGYDFKIDVEVISTSPLRNEEEEKKFLKFLSYVQNFPQISLSPLLTREAAYRAGYRNEKVIREMQRMAQLTMLGAAAQQNGGQLPQGPNGNQTAQAQVAQQTPNTQEQITNQLTSQLQ